MSHRFKQGNNGAFLTQIDEKLNVNMRTIMDSEIGCIHSKVETIFLITSELHISLNTILYTGTALPNATSIDVLDFFSDKIQEGSEAFAEICRQIETLHLKALNE